MIKGIILSSNYIPLKTRLESHDIPILHIPSIEQIGAYAFHIYGTNKLVFSTGYNPIQIDGYECIHLPNKEGLRFCARDARYSHDAKNLWIGYGNNSTTTHAGIEAVMNLLPSSVKVHVVYSEDHLDTWFLPLSNNRILLRGASQEVAKVFGTKNVIQVPKKYSQVCLSVCLPEVLLVPKFIQARSWLYKTTGLRIEEVNVESVSLDCIISYAI